ncbi:proteoglycan 3-like [Pyxicephalus adspersus]|uniref:proteoglycan 3-like n=1 Tax=Pyxicephalus adspersus TaxID=30357 RepID=UPI003B5AC8F0
MYCLLLILLVGTLYAQEPENCCQDHSKELADSDSQENNCEMNDTLETTSMGNCQLEQCHNVTEEVNKQSGDICPGKSTCHLQAFNCPRGFWWAQRSCKCHRGKLSSVGNSCVNNQVRCVAQRACTNQQYAWIGVWKPGNSCTYKNVDGRGLAYTNFACGQRRTCGVWCVAINLSNGLWYTFNCCTHLPYVCTI